MPVDPLEQARERLGRLMTKAHVAGGHPADDEDQSNDAHLGREFIRSRADLRLILAELDRRSPPTREGGSVEQAMDAFMSKLPGYLFDEGKLREAVQAALAAPASAPIAWTYEMASMRPDNEDGEWSRHLSFTAPPADQPPGSIRNLTPLYAGPKAIP